MFVVLNISFYFCLRKNQLKMESLIRRHLNRMQAVTLDFVRSLMDEIDWNERLLMIKGQKGVGKTTLMTQRIMQMFGPTNTTEVLYVSLDNIYLKKAKKHTKMFCILNIKE